MRAPDGLPPRLVLVGMDLPIIMWGAPWLQSALVEHGIAIADLADARAALVRIEADSDLDAIRRLRAHRPALPIVTLVDPATPALLLRAIELGALGVLVHDAAVADIAAALRDVAAGRVSIAGGAIGLLVQALRARGDERTRFALTGRERDVLVCLVAGDTTSEIADRLGIGFGTVQTHLKNIYRKLDVGSKAAAAAIALRHQLV